MGPKIYIYTSVQQLIVGFGYFIMYLMYCTETKGRYDGKGDAVLKAFIVGIKVNGEAI